MKCIFDIVGQVHRYLYVAFCIGMSQFSVGISYADEHSVLENWAGKNDFGGAGLLQTRTARSSADGLLEVGYSHVFPYKRYYLTLQGMPWLEGTFRYTDVENRLYSPFASFSGTQTFKDRGADISIRLMEESKYLPAISVTFQDGLGTGQFSGEYLSVTKRFYDLDITGGIAWGYGARNYQIKNPLAYLSSHFASRQGSVVTGGSLNVNDYFSGEFVAPYGGIAYRTPIKGLVFKAELDPNDYQLEPQSNVFSTASNFNYGFTYRPLEWFEASAAFERGNTYMFRFSLLSNLHDPGLFKFDPPPQKLKSRTEVERDLLTGASEGKKPWWYHPVFEDVQEGIDQFLSNDSGDKASDEKAIAEMFEGFQQEGLKIEFVETNGDSVQVTVRRENDGENSFDQELIAKLITTALPEQSEQITILSDAEKESISISRAELEETQVVDHLFEGLNKYGLFLENIDLTHLKAKITVSKIEPHAKANAQVALLVLRVLPTPVNEIIFVLAEKGIEIEQFLYSRDEIESQAISDEMFSNLDLIGIEVLSFDISGKNLELTILDSEIALKDNIVKIATIVEDAFPFDYENIIISSKKGVGENRRISVKRSVGEVLSKGKWIASGESSSPTTIKPPKWSTEDREYLTERMFASLRKDGISAEAIDISGSRVTVYGSTRTYRQNARNMGRAMRAMANNVPSEIEELEFVTMAAGMEVSRILVRRGDMERADANISSAEEVWANAKISKGNSGIFFPESAIRPKHRYPSLDWTFKPKLRNHLGGPDQFLLYELFLTAGFDAALWRGLSVTGRVNRSLYDNFDKISFGSSSVLPHVRTDIKEYLQQSEKYSVNRMQANYYFSPMDEWYARASAGIFEEMFGGFSAEVLHRPFDARLAIGVDVNRVWQRRFEQRFKFKDYKVTTGHLNLYYELPWYNILSSIQVGQYLAGDRGATFNFSRRFDSGVMMGMWTTLTDVSAEDFGEGSFDKGFFIRIPFDLFLTTSTKQRGTFAFRPITRDGGAKLAVQGRLHGVTSGGSRGEVMRDWNRFLD